MSCPIAAVGSTVAVRAAISLRLPRPLLPLPLPLLRPARPCRFGCDWSDARAPRTWRVGVAIGRAWLAGLLLLVHARDRHCVRHGSLCVTCDRSHCHLDYGGVPAVHRRGRHRSPCPPPSFMPCCPKRAQDVERARLHAVPAPPSAAAVAAAIGADEGGRQRVVLTLAWRRGARRCCCRR